MVGSLVGFTSEGIHPVAYNAKVCRCTALSVRRLDIVAGLASTDSIVQVYSLQGTSMTSRCLM
jgi:hypothetical protein